MISLEQEFIYTYYIYMVSLEQELVNIPRTETNHARKSSVSRWWSGAHMGQQMHLGDSG